MRVELPGIIRSITLYQHLVEALICDGANCLAGQLLTFVACIWCNITASDYAPVAHLYTQLSKSHVWSRVIKIACKVHRMLCIKFCKAWPQ